MSAQHVADAPYRIAFQTSQTPAHGALVCEMAGMPWPLRDDLQVADLGCGRGYVVNTLAAANPGWQVLGVDLSAVQIAEARAVAAEAGLDNARFIEADLGEFTTAEADRLPALDVVLLHGVWTWVSDAVRSGILRLLLRRLRPGGLVYVGYNALPAAANDLGLQRLLCRLAAPWRPGQPGAVAAAERAMAALPSLARAVPLPRTAMLQRLLAQPPQLEPAFVAHEFLTDHWRPVFHQDLCADLTPAGLNFVGSSNLFESLPALYLDASVRALLPSAPGDEGEELLKDLCLPRSFRADVFVRGAVYRGAALTAARVGGLRLAACRPWSAEAPALNTGLTLGALPQGLWNALGERFAQGPCTLAALAPGSGVGPDELLALLVGTGQVLPVFCDRPSAAATRKAQRFNQVAARRYAQSGRAAGHFALSCPMAAGGLPADALDMALIAAGAATDSHCDVIRQAFALLAPDAASQAAGSEGADPAGAGLHDRLQTRLQSRMPLWQAWGLCADSAVTG